MATDFSYNSKTIGASGPFKQTGKDMPADARTRVNSYADIPTIPNPYVGMVITVLQDENNGNVMKDYKVKSLKSNELGVANTVIDEIVPYVDYLGVSGVSGEGLTTEQAQQLQVAYEHSQSTHVQDSDLNNIDAVSLNGKKFSEVMTKEEYDALLEKDSNTIYLVDDDTAIEGIPSYSTSDANKVLAVNSDGTALAWIDAPSGSGTGLTTEQAQQLQTAYEHSQETHVQSSDIPTKTSQLENDNGYMTSSVLSNYVLVSEINNYVNDALNGATITNKSKVNFETESYSEANKTINIISGESIDIVFSIDSFTTRRNFSLSCSTNDIEFSGDDYMHTGFQFYNESDMSKSITFTAANNIETTRICYVYVAPYDEGTESVYETYKIRFIISPQTNTNVTYGDIVVTNSTSTINEGEYFTYTINLSKSPTNEQTINITTSNTDVTVNPSTLIFTSDNYNIAQEVRVDIAEDSDSVDDDCQITMSSTGVSSKSFNIKINDINKGETTKILNSITAIYTQGSTVVYPSTSLDSLKPNLVVTANYDDSSTETITDYSLSGTLSVGTSSITVSYGGKTTTFNVNVSEEKTIEDPSETIATDNLILHFDGRDVEKGSTQAYWTNRVNGKSIETYEISSQFGSPNSGWNDNSREYGWLGDSFRYYLVGVTQPQVTLSEITDNYTISIGYLQEDYNNFMDDGQRSIYNLVNSNTGVGNKNSILLLNDGSTNLYFGTDSSANIAGDILKFNSDGSNIIVNHTLSVDFSNNKVSLYVNGTKKPELIINQTCTNPRNLFKLVSGKYTTPIKIYYLRIYNKALSEEECIALYNQENSISRTI